MACIGTIAAGIAGLPPANAEPQTIATDAMQSGTVHHANLNTALETLRADRTLDHLETRWFN